MAAQQDRTRLHIDVQFRVLIIGRANAGKTSILQRVCDTTESPVIYRCDRSEIPTQTQLEPSMERGEHDIEDELTFTNHDGYIFHDSRGFEAGDETELKIVQDFVRRRSQESLLSKRLHAIWYCIPMDNARPSLDLGHFDKIYPDKNINIPVIAVFTKYDQFKREISFKLEDQGLDTNTHPALLNAEMERIFNEEYLARLAGSPPVVRLEGMNKVGQRCKELIEKTANELSDDIVTLMLLAVQKDNLELSIQYAVRQAHSAFEQGNVNAERIIKICIGTFPAMWIHVSPTMLIRVTGMAQ